ncbi:MAG: hypothetical protein IPL27_06540 [Lewinellaceae bacterium]|nr:hypothetical protein [Lewinellaceae bacterium]
MAPPLACRSVTTWYLHGGRRVRQRKLRTFWLTVVTTFHRLLPAPSLPPLQLVQDDPTDCYEPADDCKFAGVTWVPASAFNQGSYDNCNDIAFTVRRMPVSGACTRKRCLLDCE